MGVVEPLDCGLGAGGFAVVHDAAAGRESMLGVVQAAAREPDGVVVAVGDPRAGGCGRVV